MARRVSPSGARKRPPGRKRRIARGARDEGLEKLRRGDAAGALESFGAALRGGERADALMGMGEAYGMLGMDDEAMACYREALAGRPDLAEAHVKMAGIHDSWGRYADAEKSADEALRLRPASPEAKLAKGSALLNSGKPKEAVRVLEEAARGGAAPARLRARLGDALMAAGDAEGASRCFGDAAGADPSDPQARYKKGLALSELGDHGGAYRAYAEAAELEPDAAAYAGMAESLAGMHEGQDIGGWHAEAMVLADRAIGNQPGHAHAHFVKARLLEMAGMDSKEHRDAAARLDPERGGERPGGPDRTKDPLRVQLARGMLLLTDGNAAGALSHFGAMVRDAPDYGNAHAAFGTALGMSGAFDEAIKEFRKALKLGASRAATYSNMGNVYNAMGKKKEAEECYRRSSSEGSAQTVGSLNLAKIYLQQGRSAEALRAADGALRVQPGDPLANIAKGEALAGMGRFSKSARVLREAARALPESSEAYVRLGESLLAADDARGALECFDAALLIMPDDAEAHYGRATALSNLDRYGEAYDSYARSAEIAPQPQSYANMATSLSNAHAEERARGAPAAGTEWYARALALADKAVGMDEGYAYAYFVKARLLFLSGRNDEAEEQLLHAQMLDHDFVWDQDASHLHTGSALRRAGPPARKPRGPGRRRPVR